MPAPIVRIALALDELLLLELVEEADERAPVVTECVRDRGLRLGQTLVEQREDRVVVRIEAFLLVDLERADLGGETETLQEEEARGDKLGRESRARLWLDLGVNAHFFSLPGNMVARPSVPLVYSW